VTVGFVGLGNMGAPMAGRLVEAGFAVRGYDASAAARERFPHAVDSLGEVAAETVVLMLPDSSAVRRVLLEESLLAALDAGARVIDMSSSEPTETRALAGEAEQHGVELLDAPVSGGVAGAREGTLTIMAGGPPESVAACRPLLEAMGSNVMHVGPIAAGHALKALNNLLSATSLLVSSEALLIGRRFGLDPQVMVDTLNRSTGRSWSTQTKLPRFVLPRDWSSGFPMRLMVKDLQIALGLAEATGAPTPLGRAGLQLWERAAADLGEDADHTEIARWLEEQSPD
jgi:3-hydroxyisobutyrate dehydrogenase